MADSLTIATSSAALNSNATVGTATIITGETEVTINNSSIAANTLIYLTPLSNTYNQVIFVKSKTEGTGFAVAIPHAVTADISFNYWIIKTE